MKNKAKNLTKPEFKHRPVGLQVVLEHKKTKHSLNTGRSWTYGHSASPSLTHGPQVMHSFFVFWDISDDNGEKHNEDDDDGDRDDNRDGDDGSQPHSLCCEMIKAVL